IQRNVRDDGARALVAGMAAHSMLPLAQRGSGRIALALATLAHAGGWPFPRGGAQKLSNAMASYLQSLGGVITTGVRVRDVRELAAARAALLDVTPRQVLAIAGEQFPAGYRRALARYRYGI